MKYIRKLLFPLLVIILSACNIGIDGFPTLPPLDAPIDISTEAPPPRNLVLGTNVTASAQTTNEPPTSAIDGNIETMWSSGNAAPQWIQIDLGKLVTISGFRLITAQSPNGATTHQLFVGRTSSDLRLIHQFNGTTSDNQVLEFTPTIPASGIRFIQIITLESPSWVAWREIEVLGLEGGQISAPEVESQTADTIYFNGTILTMEKDNPTAEAIAIKGNKIIAVGSQSDVMTLQGDQTQVIDLKGYTMLPGFIDSHSHRIGDFDLRGFAPTDEQAIGDAIQLGWTSLHELFVHSPRLARLEELQRANKLRLRVAAYLAVTFVSDVDRWFLDYRPRQIMGDRLTVAGLKITLDQEWGEEYWLDQESVNSLVSEADDLGWQFAAHSFTIRSNDLILKAYENALNGESNETHRHRIEHVGILTDEEMERMARLGIIASVQLSGTPEWPLDKSFQRMVPPEQYPLVGRYRDMLDAGIFMIGNTDAPWGTTDWREDGRGDHKGSPMEAIFEAVTRIPYNRREPEAWQLQNRITVQEALELLTINGAYATFEENQKGSLAPGKWADLVILSDNPLTVSVESIPGIQNLITMIDGKIEYCAVAYEYLCK